MRLSHAEIQAILDALRMRVRDCLETAERLESVNPVLADTFRSIGDQAETVARRLERESPED